jgi:outer membrane protein TolC
VQQSEAAYSAARAGVRSSLTPYMPTVSLRFNRGGNGTDSRFGWGDNRYAYSQTMSFNMQFPFFNQGTREEQVVRSRVAEDVAQAQLRDARFLAQQQLVQYLSTFRSAEQRVQIQLASVEAADRRPSRAAAPLLAGSVDLPGRPELAGHVEPGPRCPDSSRFDARVAKAQIETLTGKDM